MSRLFILCILEFFSGLENIVNLIRFFKGMVVWFWGWGVLRYFVRFRKLKVRNGRLRSSWGKICFI